MADKHVLAEQDYLNGLKYKDIAEKYDVSPNTVKSWKRRHGWIREKGAPKTKGVHPKRPGAPPGNQNAKGNKGGAAPPGNQNAVTHGLFTKYLPVETLAIMEQLQERSPLDMLWDNIMIQYTAIIRAQQIMYVRDQKDMTKTLVEEKDGNVFGQKWEVQQAWDKQATFLQAQSRAMSELRSSIRQYEEMCRQGKADQEQQLRLQKLKGEVALLNKKVDSDEDKPIEILIKRKGDSS
ncbi:phage terminase small subunit [Paenibacillus sp. LX16]|uniref:phage terminase small subunit n=1 Tax=Paenibacillus sp. LX16 TaxID=1740264 RepID=UPI002E2CFCD5|nr:phage terminase small subunit [Paenibacillus sp. LX16]